MRSFQQRLSTLVFSLKLVYRASPPLAAGLVSVLFLQGLLPAAGVWALGRLVDAIVTGTMEQAALWGGVWVALLFSDQALGPLSAYLQGNLNERLTAHLNRTLMQKINSFEDLTPFEYETFYNRVQLLREQASFQPTNLIIFLSTSARDLFTAIPLLAVSATLGWWVPLALLVATAPYALVSLGLQRAIWETVTGTNPEARRMDYAASLLLNPQYAKEHRLFRTGDFWIAFYLENFRKLHRAMAARRREQLAKNLGTLALSLLGFAASVFGVLQRRPSAGQVAMLLATLNQLQQSLLLLAQDGAMLLETLLYMDEVRSFLEEKPSLTASPGIRVKEAPPRIEFDHVHFSYPDGRKALSGVSFTLPPGELFGLVGENGAGKTTLVKLLLRFYEPSEGKILVDGKNLAELDLVAWRKRVAAIFQDYGRYALTLGENVALSDLERMEDEDGVRRALASAGGEELVSKLPQGLNTPLTKEFGGTELSGGEWQKVALARAFFRERARVMVLDEPTAALDPLAEVELYQRFAELARGRTTLLISHRLASVRHAHRILVLKEGRLIEEGDHEELLRKGGEYARMWEAQRTWYR